MFERTRNGYVPSMTLVAATDACPPIGPEFLSVRLEDGSCLQIRLVTPADRAHLVDGFARLSKQSRYTRFFSYIPSLDGPVLDNLADLSGHLHVAVGAFAGNDDLGHGVAVARAIQPASGEPAELAITVVDGAQGMGLGELLLHILVVVGTKLGVTAFTATTLRENHPAGKAFRKIGAKTTPDPEDMAISLATMDSGDLKKLTGWPPELDEEIQRFATRAGQAVQHARKLQRGSGPSIAAESTGHITSADKPENDRLPSHFTTQAPDDPSDAQTEPSVVEILRDYAGAGFSGDAFASDYGLILCGSCQSRLAASFVQVYSIRRLEGASDPADNVAVLAIICPVCQSRSTMVLKYGPDASPDEVTIWHQTKDCRDRKILPGDMAPGENTIDKHTDDAFKASIPAATAATAAATASKPHRELPPPIEFE
jgi:hypothetical protein